MTNAITATRAFRIADMYAAAASLRRLSLLAGFLPPALMVWLARSYGEATSAALKYAGCALLVALPLACGLQIAAKAVRGNATQAEHERDNGIASVSPLVCRG